MSTADKYTVVEEVSADTPRLTVQVNRQTYIHNITHSQGICSQQVTINQSPPDERKLLQDMVERLERENERLRSLVGKLMNV